MQLREGELDRLDLPGQRTATVGLEASDRSLAQHAKRLWRRVACMNSSEESLWIL